MRDTDDPSPVERARTCCHQSQYLITGVNAELATGGTSDRLCWLAETCKILLLLLRVFM